MKGLDSAITEAQNALVTAETDLQKAKAKQATDTPKLQLELLELEAKADLAVRDAAIGYTLVSFSPPQLHVESELQYTDKIFLVDFKRPAGGVLDLKNATFDNEQYFADVQAEVEERTLADINTAIKTLSGEDPTGDSIVVMDATPTSAGTPASGANESVEFQKSVVATRRFDIAECHWEERMRHFVDEHLGRVHLPVVSSPSESLMINSAPVLDSPVISDYELAPIEVHPVN